MTNKNNKNCQLNILTLEDSSLDAELIYEYLRENFGSGIQMDVVSTEDEFLSALSIGKYNLILSDFNLPDFNGFEALGSEYRRTPAGLDKAFAGSENVREANDVLEDE